MEEILAALADQQAELDGLISPVDDAAWANPSRCPGWSVSDVVLHLAQTNEMATGSLTGTFDQVLTDLTLDLRPSTNVDDGAGLMVEHERGAPAAHVYDRYRDGVDDMMRAYRAIDPHERVKWVAGTLSAHTLASTRLSETWIHTNDVAFGFGIELPPSDRLQHIARLAWRTLPYAFQRAGREMHGAVEFDLVGPAGQAWRFAPDDPAVTVVRGTAVDLCDVAGQRAVASDTALTADGPDAADVLELVRTFA